MQLLSPPSLAETTILHSLGDGLATTFRARGVERRPAALSMDDLFRNIFARCDAPSLKALCLTSTYTLKLAGPLLYENVVIHGICLGALFVKDNKCRPGDALDSERLRPFLSLDNIKTLTILVPEHPSNGVWYCDLGRVSKGRPRGSLLGDVPDPNSGLTTNRPKRTIRFVPKSSILGSLDDVPVKARKVKVGIIDLSPSDASSWSQVSSLVIVDSFSRFFHDPAARHMFARHMFNPIVPTTSPPSRRLKSTPKRTQIQPFISSRYLPEHWAFAPPSVEGVVDLRNVTIPGDEATLEGALIGLLDRDKKQDRVEKRPDRGPFKVWFASQEAKRLMERKLVSRDNRVGGRYMSGGTMVIKERDQA